MEIPSKAPVMILPGTTLFPQAWQPLFIFEPRYRAMLADALETHRMFVLAMQKENHTRETPSSIAGLGLIRIAMDNPDGTSNLLLQGIARVRLGPAIRYKPYRIHRIYPLQTPRVENDTVEPLLAKVRDLVHQRLQLGFPWEKKNSKKKKSAMMPMKEVARYIDEIKDPDQVADLVTCALLGKPDARQTILETLEVEPRLRHLIDFLIDEIAEQRKHKKA